MSAWVLVDLGRPLLEDAAIAKLGSGTRRAARDPCCRHGRSGRLDGVVTNRSTFAAAARTSTSKTKQNAQGCGAPMPDARNDGTGEILWILPGTRE